VSTPSTLTLLWKFDEARLLWDSKGLGIEAVAAAIASKPELSEYKLSTTSLQRLSLTSRTIPEPVAALIEALEPAKNRKHLAEIVETGLRVVHGEPVETKRDPRELALAILAEFPADEVALKLADALAKQAQLASGTGSLLDVFARAIADRLPHTPKVDEIAQHLDQTSAKRLVLVAGVATSVACLVWFLLGALTGRLHLGVTQPMVVVASMGEDGMLETSDSRSWLGLAAQQTQMGEKTSREQRVPVKPFPGQKVPPCNAEAGEVEVNGGCWGNMTDSVKPPCGRYLYRSGDKCYRPVAADPQNPTTETP
jgi:hypothetical protein